MHMRTDLQRYPLASVCMSAPTLPHRSRSALSAIAATAVVVPVLLVACAAPVAQPPPTAPAVSDVADVSSAAPASDPAAASGPSSAAPRGTLVVHGTGDVNLDPAYIPALRTRGYAHAWAGLDGLFTGDDLTVVNLECPVSDLSLIHI